MGQPNTSKPASRPANRQAATQVIGAFKLFDGVLLLVAAVGALKLVNGDVVAQAQRLVTTLHVDPNNHYLQKLLSYLPGLDRRKLEEISAGGFLYSGLLLTEGVGLWLRKRWAEYLTVIVTGLFIPLELYELARGFSPGKLALLVVNAAIVAYLIYQLRQNGEHAPHLQEAAASDARSE